MNFEEHAAKPLLAEAGIAIPQGAVAESGAAAAEIAARLGPVVVKAQVPAGKRGKAGGIKTADTPEEAAYYQHGGILRYVLRRLLAN